MSDESGMDGAGIRTDALQAGAAGLVRLTEALRTAGDSLNVGLAVFDADSRMIYSNRLWTAISGMGVQSSPEMTAERLLDRLDPDQRERAAQMHARLLRGESGTCEFSGLHPDGDLRHVRIFLSPVLDEGGTYLGNVSTIIDVTPQKLAEKARCEAEDNFRAMLDAISDAVYLYSSSGEVLAVNQAGAALRGLPPESMLGLNRKDIFSGERLEQENEDIERLIAEGKPFTAKRREGDILLESHFRPILDAHGQVSRLAVYSRDITEQALARDAVRKILIGLELRAVENAQELDDALAAVRRKESELQALLDNIPDFAWLKDEYSRFILVNEAYATTCGYPADWIKGKTDTDVWPRHLAERYLADDDRVMSGDRPIRFDEPMLSWDGTEYVIETIKRPIRNEHGRVIGTAGVARDVTERRRAEDELEHRRCQLEQLVAERTRELENNVEALRAEIAERRKIEDGLQESRRQLQALAAQISEAEERERRRIALELHDRLGQTLSLAKIRLDTLMAQSTPRARAVDMEEIREHMAEAIEVTRSLIFELSPPVLYEMGLEAAIDWLGESILEKHGIGLSLEVHGDVEGIPQEIKSTLFRAVRELMVNVVKHAQAGRVHTEIINDGNLIRISVKDNGIGGVPNNPQRMDDGRMRYGLFNIRERMVHLGGDMRIESAPRAGTRITLVLPVRAGERPRI